MNVFYDALKQFMIKNALEPPQPLLSADGSTFLTDTASILKWWSEDFDSVLSRPSSINDNAINRLPQIEYNVLLDDFPTVTEITKAIQHLAFGKVPGLGAIPVEIYKARCQPSEQKLV